MERFNNIPSTTLNGAINSSVTSVVVTSVTSFPSTGDFRILVDSEIMLVTGVNSGTQTFTVARGQEGTTANSHSSSAIVTGILTEGAIQAFRRDNADKGSASSVFNASKDGRILLSTDSPYLGRDIGSDVKYSGPLFKLVRPDDSQFAWVNQGSATTSQANGGILLSAPSDDALSSHYRIRKKSAPSTPYKITAYVTPCWYPINLINCGIGFRESGTSKIQALYIVHNNDCLVESNWQANEDTSNNVLNNLKVKQLGYELHWLRLRHDGTNLYFEYSLDGFNFFTLTTNSKTAHFTTGPDEVFFFVSAKNTQQGVKMHLLSWEES